MAVVATGGYGRREVCPFSDVDVTICYFPGLKGIKEISSAVLYPLWDSGLKVGHSLRTPREAVGVASSEPDVAVSHLDARMISGSEIVYDELSDRISSFVARRQGRIVDDILERRRRRLAQLPEFDGLRCGAGYLQSDLKLGEGGLRDICAVEWSAKCVGISLDELLSEAELTAIRKSKSDLLLLRSALHLCYGRQHDYLDTAALRRMESRFGAALADRMVRRALRATVSVKVIAGRALADLAAHIQKPGMLGMLRGRWGSGSGRSAGRAAGRTVVKIGRDSEEDAGAELAEAISGPLDGLEHKLEELQTRGSLRRAIPEWEDIEGLYQRDPYHTFSVDVHSMVTPAGVLHALEKAVADSPGVWPSRLPDELTALADGRGDQRSTALRLACLLHDIGKGRDRQARAAEVPGKPEEHAEAGAGIARRVAAALGLEERLAEECGFLVRHHLLLADSASRRDVRDPATLDAVCGVVAEVPRLDGLYLLTLADASATGPQAWNAWRRSLITQLYLACRRRLEREDSSTGAGDWVAERKSRDSFERILTSAGVSEQTAAALAAAAPRAMLEHDVSSLELAAGCLQRHLGAGGAPVVEARDMGDGFYELAIAARDAHGLFAKIAGVIALGGLSVVSAQAYTLGVDPPVALDVFSVETPSNRAVSGEEREGLEARLRSAMAGKIAVGYRLALKTREWKRHLEVRSKRSGAQTASTAEPVVHVDNDFSKTHTVIEITAPNRPRLLYDVASTLSELGLDIKSAGISTIGDTAVDVFYVTDTAGRKLCDAEHIREAREALIHSLSSGL